LLIGRFARSALRARGGGIIATARLPKTRSGKILRGTIKKIADGETWTMPATIDDPAILDEIGAAMKTHGVGQ
jgi:propionyl-CoA synthetase